MLRILPRFLAISLLTALLGAIPAGSQKKFEWPPVSQEELALKESPTGGPVHAVLLFRDTYNDDIGSYSTHYYRIKILSEAGREHANIEIPYMKGLLHIRDIRARTIRPDGSVVNFEGQVFDRTVVKGRGLKVQAKTLTLPEVQVGGIIEYYYVARLYPGMLLSTRWEIQNEMPTRRARFVLRPWRTHLNLNWVSFNMSREQSAKAQKDGTILFEMENIPALIEEAYMPPRSELQMRVVLFYSRGDAETPEEFWKRIAKSWFESDEKYTSPRREVERVASETTRGAATPEEKLRHLYTRVQRIRNLTYERAKSAKEEKREKLKINNHIEDVLTNGYGTAWQINQLFVGLARAAGFEVMPMYVAERDDTFFHENLKDSRQLDGVVTIVRVGEKDLFLDPGTPYCPFGLLSWEKTLAQGIRMVKDSSRFTSTPAPRSAEAVETRKANLRLREDGTLEGKVQLKFTGQEALRRRLLAMDQDEAGRRESLEDELEGSLPSAATVKLHSVNGWEPAEEAIVAEYTIEVPGFLTSAGRRALMPIAILQTTAKNPFQHEHRVHPIYFRHPFEQVDEITVELPDGLRVESLPEGQEVTADFGRYELYNRSQPGKLIVKRRLVMNIMYFEQSYYRELRSFYAKVRAGDEQQAVFGVGQPGASQ